MERRELSLAGKLDSGLVNGLCALLEGFKNLTLWLLGLLMLPASVWVVFEYDEGFSDISWHEWGFLLLLPVLLWRHVCYCRHFASGFWRGLSRLLTFQGVLSVIHLSSIGFLLFLFLESDDLDVFLHYLSQEHPLSELAALGLTLLAVYLAAPTCSQAPSRKRAMPAVAPIPSSMANEAHL